MRITVPDKINKKIDIEEFENGLCAAIAELLKTQHECVRGITEALKEARDKVKGIKS